MTSVMTSCCDPSKSNSSNTQNSPKTLVCPNDGLSCKSVQSTTIIHHLKEPWNWECRSQGYYFCDNPQCHVIYFAEDHSIIVQSEVRTLVGAKSLSADATVCYCFGVTRKNASIPEIKAFVINSTKNKQCACDVRNPSGRCCLKDF